MTSPFLEVLGLALVEADLAAVRALVGGTLRPEGRTLEIGCGPGLFADLFATGDYVGVDPRPRFVDYARRYRPGVFVCDDLAAVGLPNARFEQAVGLDLFGPRSDGACRAITTELRRLLAPPGRVLVVEHAKGIERVVRLAAALGRIERRDLVRSGWRERVALVLST